jgi:hypothetical protein
LNFCNFKCIQTERDSIEVFGGEENLKNHKNLNGERRKTVTFGFFPFLIIALQASSEN